MPCNVGTIEYLFVFSSVLNRVLSCPRYFVPLTDFYIKSKVPSPLTLTWPPLGGNLVHFLHYTDMKADRSGPPSSRLPSEGGQSPDWEPVGSPLSESFQHRVGPFVLLPLPPRLLKTLCEPIQPPAFLLDAFRLRGCSQTEPLPLLRPG